MIYTEHVHGKSLCSRYYLLPPSCTHLPFSTLLSSWHLESANYFPQAPLPTRFLLCSANRTSWQELRKLGGGWSCSFSSLFPQTSASSSVSASVCLCKCLLNDPSYSQAASLKQSQNQQGRVPLVRGPSTSPREPSSADPALAAQQPQERSSEYTPGTCNTPVCLSSPGPMAGACSTVTSFWITSPLPFHSLSPFNSIVTSAQ